MTKLSTVMCTAALMMAAPRLAAAQSEAPAPEADAPAPVIIEQPAAPAQDAPAASQFVAPQVLAPVQVTVVSATPPPRYLVLDRERPPVAQPAASRGAHAPVAALAPFDDRVAGRVPGYSRVGRVFVELLGGLAVGASGVVTGGIIGCYGIAGGPNNPLGCMILGGAMSLPFGTLGIAGGVALAGYMMDGTGRFGWTLLGAASGTLVGTLAGAALLGPAAPVALALVSTLPMLGAILGFELSSADSRRAADDARALHEARAGRPLARNTFRVMPSVSPSSVGVVGTF